MKKIKIIGRNKEWEIKENIYFCVILILFFLTFIVSIFFLKIHYDYKKTLEKTKLNEELLKEFLIEKEKTKKEEIDVNNLTVDKIHKIQKSKKEILLNIIPSGFPLKRDIVVTSPFGYRYHPIYKTKKLHKGIDLRVKIGDPVYSTAIGKVVFSGIKGGYGKVVIIEHFNDIQTFYAHLSKLDVEVGEMVGKGTKIGEGGNTGRSTGPHLHYEIRQKEEVFNPETFMNWNLENFQQLFNEEKNIDWEKYFIVLGKN